jgi:hypothetical protein
MAPAVRDHAHQVAEFTMHRVEPFEPSFGSDACSIDESSIN